MPQSKLHYKPIGQADITAGGDKEAAGRDESLSDVELNTPAVDPTLPACRGRWAVVTTTITVLSFFALLLLAPSLFPIAAVERRPHDGGGGSLVGVCAADAAESRRRGCVFDPMMYNWVAPACAWPALSDRYWAAGNWTFYLDAAGTRAAAPDAVRRGDAVTVWVAGDFHHSHCAYILHKRLAMERPAALPPGSGAALDSKSRSVAHTEHCLGWLSRPKPQVFDLVTLNFSREALGCVAGPLDVDCYSPEGADICWPGQGHSIQHHPVEA